MNSGTTLKAMNASNSGLSDSAVVTDTPKSSNQSSNKLSKKRIVVICPGRGTYTKETLGYLQKYGSHAKEFISDIDARRKALGEPTITELDSAGAFKPNLHTKGENASSLIYACSYADFAGIDREKYEIVAITGNSMGWYLALAFAGSLDWAAGFNVINTMGSMMKNEIIGGQVIYPVSDDQWKMDLEKHKTVKEVINRVNAKDGCEVYTSIELGGYIVLGANRSGTAALLKELPATENYPFQLINHAAFHTPLMKETSQKAFQLLPESLFRKPKIPLIDGRGQIWQPYSTDVTQLYQYTLGYQVYEYYNFTRAIAVALKEFAPDHLVLLGPGNSLGGSIGQIMVENNWLSLSSKTDFTALQEKNPFLISIGRR